MQDLNALPNAYKARTGAISLVRWLCEFIGTDTELPVTHPMISVARNLNLLHRHGLALPIASRRQLGHAAVYATLLQRFEQDWSSKAHFRRELRNATKCKATFFELDTFTVLESQGLASFEESSWSALEEGTPDWVVGDRYVVECKVSTVDQSHFDPKPDLRVANRQHAGRTSPLLVTLGARMTTDQVSASLERRMDWVQAHPKVAGVMLINRTPKPPWTCAMLGRGQATHPLPVEFSRLGVREITRNYEIQPS